MKKHLSFIAILIAFSLMACQDAKVNVQDIEKDLTYFRNVGEVIPFETGMEWRDYFRQKNHARTEFLGEYTISSAQAAALIGSVSTLAGVAFHHAYDASGHHHIIAIPIDESLSLWADIPGRIYIDTNTGDELSRVQAQAWSQNYRDAHPGKVWFHFFGGDVFDEMATLPYFDAIDIEQAVNILDFTPQLLLIVWNDDLNLLGRMKDEPGTVYDASNPCPPCGVHD